MTDVNIDVSVDERRRVIRDAITVEKADRFRAEVFAAGRTDGTDVADTAKAQLAAIDTRLGTLQRMLDELPPESPAAVTEPTAAGLPVDPAAT